ncbi:hypothetical protein LZ318_31895 [Saccharopolyspora indica]|uniref:hypothetical protein n=1 Tax=Saccharopolyspora indica TaxID=1229659 RepID=UPI0022EB0B7D|nr:hypothetical protein [Saccharopolyspora indica]MDA3644159.1 hypothetical protein [Saccharopolyspora indica]
MRRAGLFLVMLGAFSLSFAGQVDAVKPLLGQELAIVFAATNDVAALLALNEVLNPAPGRGVRGWAWVALILGGGTALVLNTWHAIKAAVLPSPAAILVGAEPVVLAWVLSHVVALVLSARRGAAAESASEDASGEAQQATESAPTPVTVTPSPEAVGSAPETAPAPAQPTSLVAIAPVPEEHVEAAREALPESAVAASDEVPEDLIDRAEKAERRALERSGGKRGLSYREAPRRLGVRYGTARAALDAARARMESENPVAAEAA